MLCCVDSITAEFQTSSTMPSIGCSVVKHAATGLWSRGVTNHTLVWQKISCRCNGWVSRYICLYSIFSVITLENCLGQKQKKMVYINCLLSVLQGLITAITPLPLVHDHAWDRTLLRWVVTDRLINTQYTHPPTHSHTHKHTNSTTHCINTLSFVYRWRLKW